MSYLEEYRLKHTHPLNRLTHAFGIPAIVISLPLFFFNWKWALGLFIVGWVFQFIGHAIEGNQPAFFKNPLFLLVGPIALVNRLLGIFRLHKHSSKITHKSS